MAIVPKKGKFASVGKNPNVKTHFLPDRDREIHEREEKEKLKAVFIAEQDKIKEEMVEITFSYWDGGGHRRKVVCKKGDTISVFLGEEAGWKEVLGRALFYSSTARAFFCAY